MVEVRRVIRTKVILAICIVLIVILAFTSAGFYARIDSLQKQINTLEMEKSSLQSVVEALETRVAKKGYISISPAAFKPTNEKTEYYLWGSELYGQWYFVADVQLPHGARVTNMTVYLYDNSASYDVDVTLYKSDLNKTDWCMASTTSSGTPGYSILYDDSILSPEIDNQHYLYYIAVFFGTITMELRLKGVIIEYEYQV